MPVFCNKTNNKRFFFIHIPRTAGRFLGENFANNGFEIENEDIWKNYEGIELAHFHKDLYQKYLNVSNIEHVCIVRDPVQRFFSASSFLKNKYHDINDKLEDFNFFNTLLKSYTFPNNWFRPQVEFITEKTNIWYYEMGFGKDFEQWISSILEVPININKIHYDVDYYDFTLKVRKNLKIISNIKNFYKNDYEKLDVGLW